MKYMKSNQYKTKTIHFCGVTLMLLITLLVSCECGDKKPEAIAPPWLNNEYNEVADSVLLQKAQDHDTLAAMTYAWRKIRSDSVEVAIKYLKEFNFARETASDALNYLNGLAYSINKSYDEAITYFNAMENFYQFPQASHYLAQAYRLTERFDQAIELYDEMAKQKIYRDQNIEDSILLCHADQGDTLAAIQIGKKMLDNHRVLDATPYFYKYVPLVRGKVPTLWYFWAGKTYFEGNNFVRASVYFEAADADTTFAELKYLLGVTYYNIEAYDSAYSKFIHALKLGDSSYSTMLYVVQTNIDMERQDSALYYSYIALEKYPEKEFFYYLPARNFYDHQEYEKLKQLAASGVEHAPRSYKLYTYYISAHYFLGDVVTGDSLFEVFLDKYKMYPGAFSEVARMYRTSLDLPDYADRLEKEDISNIYPHLANALTIYHRVRERDPENARKVLEQWIANDTAQATLKLMEEFYREEYPAQS